MSARLRKLLPVAISVVLLAYLFTRIDVRQALDYMTAPVLLRFLGPLFLFNAVTVGIEAVCLHRVAHACGSALAVATAARIKAACYLLSLMNYAIGAAGLSVLLRRRAGLSLADAAGMVFVISLLDIGSVLSLAALGAGSHRELGLRVGFLSAAVGAIVAGFVFLRAPIPLGPLERVRRLELFRAPRTLPLASILELGILRAAFVGCYVGLAAALFWAFDIEVGLLRLAFSVAVMLAVSALPIAAGGLGTGQIVFVELFSGLAPDAQLLSASIVFSFGLITTRALMGLVFAPEFTREAIEAARHERHSGAPA